MALNPEQRERVDSLIFGHYVDDDDDEQTELAYQELMAAISDPEELHDYALAYNWDDGTGPLRDIIAHPRCDLGTALLIYWMGGPNYYLQYRDRSEVPEHELDTFDLLAEIEQSFLRAISRPTLNPSTPETTEEPTGPRTIKRFSTTSGRSENPRRGRSRRSCMKKWRRLGIDEIAQEIPIGLGRVDNSWEESAG